MPAPAGLKKQVLGLVLSALGVGTALLSRIIGFQLDSFYIVIIVAGVALFLYGLKQSRQTKPDSL